MSGRGLLPASGRALFLAVMGLWALMPLAVKDTYALDATHWYVADQVARENKSDEIYPLPERPYDQQPAATELTCPLLPDNIACSPTLPPFTHPPPSLVLARVSSLFGAAGNVWTFRLTATVMMILGMCALWNRVIGAAPRAGTHVVIAALLLTPLLALELKLGQNSPLMFLSACLGIRKEGRARTALVGSLWAVVSAVKLFPLALGLVLVNQRRWRTLGWAAAALSLLVAGSLFLVPPRVYTNYVSFIPSFSGAAGSVAESASFDRFFDWVEFSTANQITSLLRVVGLILAAYFAWKRTSGDTQWAMGWLIVSIVQTQVWWHYAPVAFVAFAYALLSRADDPPRTGWLVAIAAVMSAISLYDLFISAYGLVQAVFLVTTAAVTLIIARPKTDACDRRLSPKIDN